MKWLFSLNQHCRCRRARTAERRDKRQEEAGRKSECVVANQRSELKASGGSREIQRHGDRHGDRGGGGRRAERRARPDTAGSSLCISAYLLSMCEI